MSSSDRDRWDAKYANRDVPDRLEPSEWLVDNVDGINPGQALELACGLGHNAIWLAQSGWTVDAVDVSPVGLKLAERLAARHGQQVNWITGDLDHFQPAVEAYDLVAVFKFLDRERVPLLIDSALRPGGLLVYETFTADQLKRPDNHLRNPAHTLEAGELPKLFPGLLPLSYQKRELTDRSVAQLLARKP